MSGSPFYLIDYYSNLVYASTIFIILRALTPWRWMDVGGNAVRRPCSIHDYSHLETRGALLRWDPFSRPLSVYALLFSFHKKPQENKSPIGDPAVRRVNVGSVLTRFRCRVMVRMNRIAVAEVLLLSHQLSFGVNGGV